jgi:hypothetical protein
MSRIVAGQLRLMEESSILQARHMGEGLKDMGKNPSAPKAKEQDHPNLKRDVSHRGLGQGIRGEIKGFSELYKNSTYKVPFEHFSVGFDLMKEDNKDLDKVRKLIRSGKRHIVHPERMGKSDKSGMSLPHKKEHKPAKLLSTLITKEAKKVHNIVSKAETKAERSIKDMYKNLIKQ